MDTTGSNLESLADAFESEAAGSPAAADMAVNKQAAEIKLRSRTANVERTNERSMRKKEYMEEWRNKI